MGEHDALFKRAFSQPAHAAAELASVLPAEVAAALDLAAFEVVPGSFVDAELVDRHADLLFRTTLVGEGEAFVYLLMEHQSQPDALMPWRILVYMMRIWEAWRRDSPDAERLPPIIPLVVHHGASGWTAPTRFHALVAGLDRVPELSRFVPNFELCVDDLCTQSDADLGARAMPDVAKLALWMLRDGRDVEEVLAHIAAWSDALASVARDPRLREDAIALLRYILKAAGKRPAAEIQRIIVNAVPATEELMPSAADELIEQGLQRGLRQGRQEGRQEGQRNTFRRLLVRRFGAVPEGVDARIDRAAPDEIDRWLDRLLAGASVEDALAD